MAYFLQSAEMASDDKFEEKMKVFFDFWISSTMYHANFFMQDFRAFITDSLTEN